MRREFIIKLMQAKKLEYEALKELMPEKIENHINDLEREIISTVKEYIFSEFMDDENNKKQTTTGKSNKEKVQKVTIE